MKNRGRFFTIAIIIVVFFLINSFGGLIKFSTDYLWFKEVGYTQAFLTKLKNLLLLGVPIFIVLSVLIFLFVNKLKKKYEMETSFVDKEFSKKISKIIILLSILLSFLVTISTVSTLWFEMLQFLNATNFGFTDPIFNLDIGFYIFKLPLINTILNFIINTLFIVLIITVLFNGFLYVKDNVNNFSEKFNNFNQFQTQVDFSVFKDKIFLKKLIKQVSFLSIFIFIALGVSYVLRTYDLLYSDLGRIFGAGYTDIHVTLILYRILAVGFFISAVTFFVGSRMGNLKLALAAPLTLIAISIIGTFAIGAVENFIVEPDQLNKESKYIEYSIANTQKAYSLDDVKILKFEANEELNLEGIKKNQEVIENVRINDNEPLIQVYNQLQGIRPYYVFNDVDVDRYVVDNVYTQVFISARELDQTRLNDQARTWINQYLKYTHGYGITMSPVRKVTAQGQPEMIVKNIPPVTQSNLKINRPEIYFGEKTNNSVIVNTNEKEFDYPSGSDNMETTYVGKAGIKLSFLNKLLFSLREGSYRLLISNNIDESSKLLFNRNIMQRVYSIAPYIMYDPNAYIVSNQDDGKLYWIIEGFTVSDRFPYSQPTENFVQGMKVNYVRNSVKVVVDAYDGAIDYYISDPTDPIINTYNKIFKDLFKPIEEMPQGLRSHIRYSKSYFDVQAEMYRLYHIENPTVFFGREDYWDIADEKYMDKGEKKVSSSYSMFKLPDEENIEFLITTQYTPQNKDNMIAMLVGRNDKENYGELVIYEFPKTKTIPGPNMIETKIDQDTVISSQLTLWGQVGSTVLRGNVLVIPLEQSLLYIEPIYLKSDTQSNFPEMKMVVVSFGDRIIMEPTLSQAIDKLFGVKVEEKPPIQIPQGTDINSLINQANQYFIKANEASKSGDWTSYGENLKLLENTLKNLNNLVNNNQNNNQEKQNTQWNQQYLFKEDLWILSFITLILMS